METAILTEIYNNPMDTIIAPTGICKTGEEWLGNFQSQRTDQWQSGNLKPSILIHDL